MNKLQFFMTNQKEKKMQNIYNSFSSMYIYRIVHMFKERNPFIIKKKISFYIFFIISLKILYFNKKNIFHQIDSLFFVLTITLRNRVLLIKEIWSFQLIVYVKNVKYHHIQ